MWHCFTYDCHNRRETSILLYLDVYGKFVHEVLKVSLDAGDFKWKRTFSMLRCFFSKCWYWSFSYLGLVEVGAAAAAAATAATAATAALHRSGLKCHGSWFSTWATLSWVSFNSCIRKKKTVSHFKSFFPSSLFLTLSLSRTHAHTHAYMHFFLILPLSLSYCFFPHALNYWSNGYLSSTKSPHNRGFL